jgi:hypothetical protein
MCRRYVIFAEAAPCGFSIIAETRQHAVLTIQFDLLYLRRIFKMASSNKKLVPEAKEALDKFKMEAANEVGVNLKQGYNGDLTSKQAGSVGGQMVKKMIESYENSIKTK